MSNNVWMDWVTWNIMNHARHNLQSKWFSLAFTFSPRDFLLDTHPFFELVRWRMSAWMHFGITLRHAKFQVARMKRCTLFGGLLRARTFADIMFPRSSSLFEKRFLADYETIVIWPSKVEIKSCELIKKSFFSCCLFFFSFLLPARLISSTLHDMLLY